MDTAHYLDVFIDESREHLDVLYKQLLELEKNPKEMAIIEEIFRAAHTLKGMAATMGYEDLTNLTHKLENIFDGIRNDAIQVTSGMVDVLFESVDDLNEMVEGISVGEDGSKNIVETIKALDEIEQGNTSQSTSSTDSPHEEDGPIDTQRSIEFFDEFELSILNESEARGFVNYDITIKLSEGCLLKGARTFMVFDVLEKMGEVIKAEPPVHELEEENFDLSFTVVFVSKQPLEEIKAKILKVSEIDQVSIHPFSLTQYKNSLKSNNNLPIKEESDTKRHVELKEGGGSKRAMTGQAPSKTIRVNIERLDILMNLFEELVIDRGRLEQISSEFEHQDLHETVERMTRISTDLQNVILNMRMVPIDQVFSRFPSMIRRLSRDLHKKISLNIIGADTELDRTVIDEIGDPLIHLLRNAVDHGIESPEARRELKKPEEGTIRLEAYHSGNHVFIEIADDGGGIRKETILSKAIQNQLINEEEAKKLSDQEIYELILASGFSTADKISDVSGRGVGLDVVRNTIESLGGNISIDSQIEKGTTFSIQLPLTLSIISVMLVDIEKEKFAVPLSSIIETAIINKNDIFSARDKRVIDFRGNIVPLVYLNELFSISTKGQTDDTDYISIVIVKKGDNLAGLVVGSFIGQQEVVLKSLGNYLTNVFAISGATILGDGEVALIIDSNALVK